MKTGSTAIAAELCELYDGEHILHKHATVDQFRKQASADEQSYFTFAGVRNPMDVAVSRYVLRKAGKSNAGNRANVAQTKFIREHDADFNQYFQEFVGHRKWTGIGIAPKDWKTVQFRSIDFIYRYEDLPEVFSYILETLGVTAQRTLPQINVTKGKDKYLDYYDQNSIQIARKHFAPYMDYWGYTGNKCQPNTQP